MTKLIKNPVLIFVYTTIFLQLSRLQFCVAVTNITRGQSLRDGESLLSADKTFELGFFSPENSTLRYLGIWYCKIDKNAVVWVANRENPIHDRSGVLQISKHGDLFLSDGNENKNVTFWSTKASGDDTNKASHNWVATLKNDGNFVLSSGDDTNKPYWQSFDHPTDTYLPGMRVRVNQRTGENRVFVSWKSRNDPSPGSYEMGVDPSGAPQIVIWEGESRRWRSGPWDGRIFIGVPLMSHLTTLTYGFKVSSPPEKDGSTFISYLPLNSSDLIRFRIRYDGKEEQSKWDVVGKKWSIIQSLPSNECENYNRCGNFGFCDSSNSNRCSCVKGYVKDGQGCRRRSPLKCERNGSGGDGKEEDKFFMLKVKLPDFETMVPLGSSETCEDVCLKNCSCNGFANDTGIGCFIWTRELADMQHFDNGGETRLYLRLASSEFEEPARNKLPKYVVALMALTGACLCAFLMWLVWRFKEDLKGLYALSCCKKNDTRIIDMSKSREYFLDFSGSADLGLEGNEPNATELPIYSFNFIAQATNNFSEQNKLGRGGFGSVYKGIFPGGQEIAIKRLSGQSTQGLEEFKNEIILIAKLQHVNLVKILGYCIEGEEKMLIYEYMPHKSLDCHLFNESKRPLLTWTKRFEIIHGIARGLLYLHRDSRLRIIHRDLKASNVLLDADMTPKISDFGMARIFGGNQYEANTVRVVGTYGYMSPEYAMEGLFSVKSDVYSFGVLLLELVSGRMNTSFRFTDYHCLIGFAWQMWQEEKPEELYDPTIRDSSPHEQLKRCVHIGMLCVQDAAAHRPNMASIMQMLESETSTLPQPIKPTFTPTRRSLHDIELGDNDIVSINDLTLTTVLGR